ncbi:hypothetical protein [Streptomyces sp. NPDC048623]|uniref:hypothetical protein n=1 Tax=Streptomyces sp. NPDC048623 TaxID=3155761 RepID=UPI00342A2E11
MSGVGGAGMDCERLREAGAELALGILPARERAEAVAHLDRCPDCRAYVERLTAVGDGLLGLLPGAEPPVGFETRVVRAMPPAPEASASRSSAPETSASRSSAPEAQAAPGQPAAPRSRIRRSWIRRSWIRRSWAPRPGEQRAGEHRPEDRHPQEYRSEDRRAEDRRARERRAGEYQAEDRWAGEHRSKDRQAGDRQAENRGAEDRPPRDPRSHAHPPHTRPSPAHPSRMRRFRLAVGGVVAALVFGFGGWAVGTVVEGAPPAPRVVTPAPHVLEAALLSAGGSPVGRIYAHPADATDATGGKGWVYMSVDLGDRTADGPVRCLLVRADGSAVPLGSFPVRAGYGYWGAPTPVDPGTLSGARLVAADGTVLATAHFAGAGGAATR